MKKYPDNTEFLALKKARRREIAKLSPTERLKIAKRLEALTRNAPGRLAQKRSANWTLAKGRSKQNP